METKAPVMFTGTTPLDSSGHADKPVPRTGISDKAGKNVSREVTYQATHLLIQTVRIHSLIPETSTQCHHR